MRGTAANKAFFYDGIPGDLLKLAASQCAELFYPLFLKQVVWQQEALIFKGGRLVPLFKKGDPSQCANFRSIFVSSPVGKILHGLYRQELGQHFVHAALPMQIGGLKGHTIVQASHALMLGQSIAIQENQSFAVLFIDIQNAFYRLMRKHLTDSKQDLRSIQELFDSLSLPKEAFDEFRLHFLEGPTLSEETVSPFLAGLFREFYETTWFAVAGNPTLTWARRGSRPGDSFADLCFGYVLARILKKVEADLIARFPFLQLQWNGAKRPQYESTGFDTLLGPSMPIWADDISLAVMHESPATMLQVIPEVANSV